MVTAYSKVCNTTPGLVEPLSIYDRSVNFFKNNSDVNYPKATK